MTRVISCEISSQRMDYLRHITARISGATVRETASMGATEISQIKFGNSSHRLRNIQYSLPCICSFTCCHIFKWTMDHNSESQIQLKARSANERQDTPRKKACSSKFEHVLFRPIQHSAQLKFPSSYFRVSSTTLLNGFSKKHSPFKLIALSGS